MDFYYPLAVYHSGTAHGYAAPWPPPLPSRRFRPPIYTYSGMQLCLPQSRRIYNRKDMFQQTLCEYTNNKYCGRKTRRSVKQKISKYTCMI